MNYISPIGALRIEVTEKGLKAIKYLSQEEADMHSENAKPKSEKERGYIAMCVSVLNRYFAKQWGAFEQLRSNIPLDLEGTDFQKKVWATIYSMPNTYPIAGICYSELAFLIGSPDSVRACAKTCGENSIPIIIPCHRIIQKDGTLGGYAGGIERKSWLLWHEGAAPKSLKSSILLQQPPQAR
ncbi:MAG: methylated-DNA--[protein]-cysteine S-methyltransferase [Fibromonadaceae bacterium]|nr:methylated-DNA--[protein]-cysteine S-methyltransferase [Fibromonadaceae bacterium]